MTHVWRHYLASFRLVNACKNDVSAVLMQLHRGADFQGRQWDPSSLDRRSESITRYTNAPITMFVPEGTVVATDGRFVKMFFLNIILAKLSTKKLQKFKKPINIHKNAKILI